MKKHWKGIIISLVVILVVADLGGAYYLFNFAFKKGGYSARNAGKPLTTAELWAKKQPQETWQQTSKDQAALKLKARYYPATKKTAKTMVLVHGYGDNSLTLGPYIKMYHQAGYNVLAPDNRSFGRSEGQYIGYGWQDRNDLQTWIQQVIQHNGKNSQIGLFGVSMGASTVMYYLGLKVPKQVQFAVADCGYASIKGELQHELQVLFNLPSFPLIPTANLFTQAIAHYSFYDADTKTTLRHNKVPLFIIHGTKDNFVPTKNARINYNNDHGPKKLWLVPDASHARSYFVQPKQYTQKVLNWSQHYFN
ncbi:alpha/beta hydrolase [Bombilactobacillus thymidiniphilus]|uniref:Alpha/beta hydrolase n=1 Tax=Bombilactobacillus thymidiniphilus TaxID=2923363 RepID=A0ABY4PBB7_9LACO|nr:alpha/beta hydrolase [Bombilactobacillus thymidiniphilus]UQS83044.1 alpha/beta hydrolase [Bombilactobacillus thymidiniphilus]